MPTGQTMRFLLWGSAVLNLALAVHELVHTHYREAIGDHLVTSALALLCLGYIKELRDRETAAG